MASDKSAPDDDGAVCSLELQSYGTVIIRQCVSTCTVPYVHHRLRVLVPVPVPVGIGLCVSEPPTQQTQATFR